MKTDEQVISSGNSRVEKSDSIANASNPKTASAETVALLAEDTLVQKFKSTRYSSDESMKMLIEDFGGQDCFYELYSILFSRDAVYVLVFNM